MISQQWTIKKMEWEEANVGVRSLRDFYMLDRKEKEENNIKQKTVGEKW